MKIAFFRNGVEAPLCTKDNFLDYDDITKVEFSIWRDDEVNVDVFDFSDPFIKRVIEAFPEADIIGKVEGEETVFINLRQATAFLGVTDSLKQLSKCTRLKVCCVIEKNGRIISTGLNGTPAGFKNCNQVFTPMERLKSDYSTRHHGFSEAYEVHAEMNALLELGKNSSMDSYDDLTLYCSTCPCPGCSKMIAQSGIKYVFFSNEYDRMPEGAKHLKEFGIYVFKC